MEAISLITVDLFQVGLELSPTDIAKYLIDSYTWARHYSLPTLLSGLPLGLFHRG